MYRSSAPFTPAIMKTISTPENSHVNDRLVNPSRNSRTSCVSGFRLGFGAGPDRNGISFCVPYAEYQMVNSMSTPSVSAKGV